MWPLCRDYLGVKSKYNKTTDQLLLFINGSRDGQDPFFGVSSYLNFVKVPFLKFIIGQTTSKVFVYWIPSWEVAHL